MRTVRWNLVVWGFLTAGALAWAGPAMAQGVGPGGTGTGQGPGGGGNPGGGTNGSSNTTGSTDTTVTGSTGVAGLDSFANVGANATGRAAVSSVIAPGNFLGPYYTNPYNQGLAAGSAFSPYRQVGQSAAAFGTSAYASLISGNGITGGIL